MRQVLWFGAYWVAGVVALGIVGLIIKSFIG